MMTKKEIVKLYLADLNNLVPDSDAKRSRVYDLEHELQFDDTEQNRNEQLEEFIEEIEYMMKLYGNQKYTQAEAKRDELAEKLDDIMRLGNDF